MVSGKNHAKIHEPELIPVFIPTLSSLLMRAEELKGTPLTEQDVLAIRDKGTCVMTPTDVAAKMDETRGYRDIDPENCWFEWLLLRQSMGKNDGPAPTPAFQQIDSKDPKYQQTIRDAQSSLGKFRKFLKRSSGPDCLFKIYIKGDTFRGYLWLTNAKEKSELFLGRIFEVPDDWTGYAVDAWLEAEPADIKDWMVIDNGTLHGGFSLRYSREKMPEDQHAAYDEFLGVKKYAPVPK